MFKKILLAVAVQRFRDLTPQALGARDTALALAKVYGAKVVALTVLSRLVQIPPEEEKSEDKFKRLLQPLWEAGIDTEMVVREGLPQRVVLEVAKEKEVDLIVVAAHTKKAPLDLSLGGVAASLLKNTPVRLIMVGPSKEEAVRARDMVIPDYPEIFPYI